jgi:hypothetical protein
LQGMQDMKIYARFCFVLSILFLFSFPGISLAGCEGGVAKAKPAWVDSPESVTDQYYFAAGVSDKKATSLAERIASAKQNALKSLAEMIEVDVKNSLVLEQSMKQHGGSALTDTSLLSITKTSTNASLKNVEAVATWEDPQNCLLWLQVRVSKESVERGKREGLSRQLFANLNTQISAAQDASAPTSDRVTAVDAAMDILPRIEFEFIPEASSPAYYTQQLRSIKQTLSGMLASSEQAKKQMEEAAALVDKAALQNNEVEKSKDIVAATQIYKALLNRHPKGLAPLFGPGDVFFKLGEAEELRGNQCGAKDYYLQAVDAQQVNARQPIARKRADALVCSAEDMEKSRWRVYFEGRQVDLICYFVTPTSRGHWQKTCDSVSNVVRSLGADVAIKPTGLPEGSIGELQRGEVPAALAGKSNLTMVYFASGKMNKRADKNNPNGGREYQFDGAIGAVMIDGGQMAFSDRFQGTTGWNPISSQMVMDVLAINVVKRWQDKFAKYLRHEVDQ